MKLRREPILIASACLGPFVLALLIYFGPVDDSVLPALDNPERELVAGATRTLPAIALRSVDGARVDEPWASYRWSLIYVGRLPCDEICRRELERLRQVHDGLGADRHRVRRVFLHFGTGSAEVRDPALVLGALDGGRAALWAELFAGAGAGAGRFFVADPLGNLVVAYPAGAERKPMLEDIERLLDVSRIG